MVVMVVGNRPEPTMAGTRRSVTVLLAEAARPTTQTVGTMMVLATDAVGDRMAVMGEAMVAPMVGGIRAAREVMIIPCPPRL